MASQRVDNIPKEQWAQVIEERGKPVTYKKVPVREPGPDEVLVNIKYSGVCHTDLHALRGDWPLATKIPLIGGHEGAGVIVATGALVDNVKVGDYAGVKWLHGSCLACSYCQQADEPLCPKALLSGYTVDGTFQQYCVAKAAHVAIIPKECSLEAIAPVLCAGITVYKGLKESGIRPGQTVAIVGAGGGLGSLACQYAKAMGLDIIAIDGGNEKKELVQKLGAKAYVDFMSSKDLVAEVKSHTEDGLGPHAVILLAVSEKPFQQAAEYVRPRGTCVAIGLPANAFLKASVFETVIKMITIKGSYVGNRRDTAEAIEFFRRGLIKAPYKVVGLSQLQSVYDLMEAGKIAGRYVVDTSNNHLQASAEMAAANNFFSIIAGVGAGTGRSVALKFAKTYPVVLLARSPANFESIVNEINASGGQAYGISTDVSSPHSVANAFSEIQAKLRGKKLAAAVYNVGGGFVRKPFLEMTLEEYEAGYQANGRGFFLFSQGVLPLLLDSVATSPHPPSLIVTGATASLRGSAQLASFASGKFALRATTQSLAREFGPQGVHVAHAIIDGVIDIPRTKEWLKDAGPDAKINSDAIADSYWYLHTQPRSSFTQELDIRPYVEKF
ncbi:uncharacterized protein BP5553_04757 [Venustampulla echinocandica]|uniref:alcohol dehydrogenase n=1 Tax=Venustampulla echinocandica TaxID=2656787 RepID=A0A370TP79_9HELO|nr:uncharacterized protein BP5553_04757 [Venustampulla echinocandica]RDL37324.1 hypothetical protein BP5553_04757 [Venustampulla echinocandica]